MLDSPRTLTQAQTHKARLITKFMFTPHITVREPLTVTQVLFYNRRRE